MRRITLYIALNVLFVITSFAQESIGIGISNYSPSNSLLLNPSSIVDSKAFMDIHLVGVSAFVRNNFVFLPGSQVSLTNPSSFGNLEEPGYNYSNAPYRAYTDVLIQGPTITATIGKHSFGLYTGGRTMADIRGIGERTMRYVTEGLQYGPFIGEETRIRDIRITALSWAEAGLSFGTIIKQRGNDLMTAGIHVKRLFGVSGAGIRLNDFHFLVSDSSNMDVYSLRGSYGIREPGWNTGSGWGVDLGFTYKKTLEGVTNYTPHLPSGGCETCDYKYKLSLALLDLGRVSFDPEFFISNFDESDTTSFNDFDSAETAGISDIAEVIENDLGGSDTGESSKFRVVLPAAFSAQFDYNIGYNFYANGSLIIGAPWKNSFGIQRAALLSVTPRYEIKRFEAALPISLHELRTPMVGAMLRLNSIIIGTDNLFSFFGNSDIYGADIYFHLKYTIFRSFGCKDQKNRPKRVKGGGKIIPCASW